MRNPFKDHPASVGETYVEHMGVAFDFTLRLFGAGAACFVHGLFPFLFTSTGSTMITRLHERMVTARRRHGEEPHRGDEAIQSSRYPKWIASRSLSSGRASRGPAGSQ